MISNDSITRALRAYQSEEEPERLFTRAGTYWRMLLIVEIVVCVTAFAAGAYMLVTTFFAISVTGAQTLAPQTLNREMLSATVQGLSARQAHFEEISKNLQVVADPSK